MQIQTQRFGTVEIDPAEVIQFPEALWGFPDEHAFVLLRPRPDSKIGWLQSTATSRLALPVVSLEALQVSEEWWKGASPQMPGSVDDENDPHAVLVVLNVRANGAASVNLLAPIVINATTRQGAQIVLEKCGVGTAEPFTLRQPAAASAGAGV